MQLDLLQKELFPTTQNNEKSPLKKARPLRNPESVTNLEAPVSEKPLPQSLRVPFNTELDDELILNEKEPGAFKTISEAAKSLGVPQHVLRFWESRFSQIKPMKLRGGRRYYRPEDMAILTTIKNLLYKQGYTIKGAKKAFNQNKHIDGLVLQEVASNSSSTISPIRPKPSYSKQQSQLSVIRQELMALKDSLKPFLIT